MPKPSYYLCAYDSTKSCFVFFMRIEITTMMLFWIVQCICVEEAGNNKNDKAIDSIDTKYP